MNRVGFVIIGLFVLSTLSCLESAKFQEKHAGQKLDGLADLAKAGLAKTTFAVIGDFGMDALGRAKDQKAVADLIKSRNVEFIITAGDNNYPDGEASTIDQNIGKYYRDYILNYQGAFLPYTAPDRNRFFAVLGNHDWNCKRCAKNQKPKPHLDYFELPGNERWYDVRWNNDFQLFVLDSDSRVKDGGSVKSVQATWLKEQLAKSDAKYKFVFFHHSPFSSGEHGSASRMQWPFAQWGASAVFTGHDHIYERLESDGIPYFITGFAAASSYDLPKVAPESQVRFNDASGAVFVEVDGKSAIVQAISVDGKLVDSHTILPLGP